MTPQLFFGKVMHKRLFPKVNGFTYGIYYIAMPLSMINNMPMKVERPGLLSFYRRDHGARDGSDLEAWIKSALKPYGISVNGEIVLVTLPRVLGYVFNPVSFWLCFDLQQNLRAVVCEVNNTFGETHCYICAHHDQRPITGDDWLHGEKFFHVSPFLEREGRYRFRFALKDSMLGIWIDHYAADGRLQLLTALTGTLRPMTRKNLNHAFWRYPLVTLKAIGLIHWQAIKLLVKGMAYVPKPVQNNEKVSRSHED